MIPAEVFAIASGLFTAINLILLKKGMAQSNAVTAIVISLGINVIVFWSFVLIFLPLRDILNPALGVFVLVGLIQPGGTRFLAYLSVQKVGVAVTAPLRATTPLFSSLLAIIVLGEQLTVPVAIGTALVVSGIVTISLRRADATSWLNIYVVLPLLSSFVAGSTQVIRKIGLAQIPMPILGAAVTTGTSLIVIVLSILLSRKSSALIFNRTSVKYFSLAGFTITMGVASVYMSLYLSDVVVVAPLSSLSPLFSLILAAIFLREVEVITLRVIIAACFIVSGVVLITAIR